MKNANETNKLIKNVCFTGHRRIEPEDAVSIVLVLKKTLRLLIENGAEHFLAGGAIGFDTVAALCVLELKEKYPHISLDLVLPCKNQTKMWSEADRKLFCDILAQADSVEYLHETYTSTCMHDRNRRLVDRADICVTYLTHSGGGTAHTVAYALKNDEEVINIYDMING